MARVAVAVVAVLLLAWLGVIERDTRLRSQALKSWDHGRVIRAEADLLRARSLDPDTAPDILRAALYLGRGERRRAATTVERVLGEEPQNLAAWSALLLIAGGHDPAAVRRARAAIRRLDPIGARGSRRDATVAPAFSPVAIAPPAAPRR